jgi:predicted ArsR family transcriptional regulator
MSVTDDTPLSRKRLRNVFEQLSNDRKLVILRYASRHENFTVAELKTDLDIPHTTAHEYCRELRAAGLLVRKQDKPAMYAAVDFELNLSLDAIATAVENESKTLDYITETYGDDSIEAVLDIWEEVDRGELTYREASTTLGMAHADFLRVADELDLFER